MGKADGICPPGYSCHDSITGLDYLPAEVDNLFSHIYYHPEKK
jgi:hypothetical protein